MSYRAGFKTSWFCYWTLELSVQQLLYCTHLSIHHFTHARDSRCDYSLGQLVWPDEVLCHFERLTVQIWALTSSESVVWYGTALHGELTKWMNPAAVSHVLMKIEHKFTSFMELLLKTRARQSVSITHSQLRLVAEYPSLLHGHNRNKMKKTTYLFIHIFIFKKFMHRVCPRVWTCWFSNTLAWPWKWFWDKV